MGVMGQYGWRGASVLREKFQYGSLGLLLPGAIERVSSGPPGSNMRLVSTRHGVGWYCRVVPGIL